MDRPWDYTPPEEGRTPPASRFSPGARPCQYAGARALVVWAQAQLRICGLDQDAKAIAQQLNLIGFHISRDSVQHQLDRQVVIPPHPTPPDPNAPPPPVMPAADADPIEVVAWLLEDIPKTASRWPGVSDVYLRARIRGYDALTWEQVVDALPVAETRHSLDHSESAGPAPAGQTLVWRQQARPRIGSPGDIPVDPEDAPEFRIASEWIDPDRLRTTDGRTLFVRVWAISTHTISLAYLALSKGGQNRVVDQGVVLTRNLRRRLKPRN